MTTEPADAGGVTTEAARQSAAIPRPGAEKSAPTPAALTLINLTPDGESCRPGQLCD
jgi:hypothetical protein